jgi:hypothetical protein
VWTLVCTAYNFKHLHARSRRSQIRRRLHKMDKNSPIHRLSHRLNRKNGLLDHLLPPLALKSVATPTHS